MKRALAALDEEALVEFGRRVGALLTACDIVFLRGPLGAGKTTFARGMLRGRGHPGTVKSPTFTLVEPYDHLDPPVYHCDLYRIDDPEELELIGFRDYLGQGIVLVEWPERFVETAPEPTIDVTLAVTGAARDLALTVVDSHPNVEEIQRAMDDFQGLT